MMILNRKTTSFVVIFLFFILLLPVIYFTYRYLNQTYLPFFLNANLYSFNLGTDKLQWKSSYFQPITQSLEENGDGIILNVKYQTSENKWIKAKILLKGKDKYSDINQVRAFDNIGETKKPFNPSERTIDSLANAKKLIPMNKQILITVYQDFPDKSTRDADNCKIVQDSSAMNLCLISDVIDQYSFNQMTFWDKEELHDQYIIPNIVILTPVNEE